MALEFPSRSVFEPPSYPNVWFYMHEALAPSQAGAVSFVTGWLHEQCGITNDFGHYKPPEASDSQARLHSVQPWRDAADPAHNHAHDLHIRYYYIALRQTGQERARFPGRPDGGRQYFRFAGSVHYEVEDEHPLHPDMDECPYCGRTGMYADAADLFAGVHEPLGLELLLYGTIRGERIVRADGRPAVGLAALEESHSVEIHRLRPVRPDMNIVDLGVVVIDPKPVTPQAYHA